MAVIGAICTFTVAGQVFGVEARSVAECTERPRVTRVPGTSPALRGLMSWRGQIVPVLDLRCCFELEGGAPCGMRNASNAEYRTVGPHSALRTPHSALASVPHSEGPALHLIVETVDGPIGLAVDDVGEVLLAEPRHRAPVPESVPAQARALIRACFAVGDGSVLLLDSHGALRLNVEMKP